MNTLARWTAALLTIGLLALGSQAQHSDAVPATQPGGWQKVVSIEPKGIDSEAKMFAKLAESGLVSTAYANYFSGRFPSIYFLNGDTPDWTHTEFFYDKPFRYYNQVGDFCMEGTGKLYGIRTKIIRYKEKTRAQKCSFVLNVRCISLDVLKNHRPSYILVNGRRIWDAKKDPIQWNNANGEARIVVPFSVDDGSDPVIDFVVDTDYTPECKGIGFRMFFVTYISEKGAKVPQELKPIKVDLSDAAEKPEGSPYDKLNHMAFGLFPNGYSWANDSGVPFAQVQKDWKPNFRPEYPTDDVRLCPFIEGGGGRSKYHDFMISYGGCNITGTDPNPEVVKKHLDYIRGGLANWNDANDTKAILAMGPNMEAHWFRGEQATSASDIKALDDAKKAAGAPDRIHTQYEQYPPSLTTAHVYENGNDVLILKNEESPQLNIMMSMNRGAGRSFGKQFGFYWEATQYPFPSLDQKLQTCIEYYMSGGSFITAEMENVPAFEKDIVHEMIIPFVKGQRFAMVHPARGTPVVPVGILWNKAGGEDDRWVAPINTYGHLDNFTRHFEYESGANTLTFEPIIKPMPWFPADRGKWNFQSAGILAGFIDYIPEIKGYDLTDVFFPKYGDAFTAHVSRLLTGTPYGPVDLVLADSASDDYIKSFGMIAILGRAYMKPGLEKQLTTALESGIPVVIGAQHCRVTWNSWAKPFGLEIQEKDLTEFTGRVRGDVGLYRAGDGKFSGKVYGFNGDGWETVAWVVGPDAPGMLAASKPLVIRKTVGKAQVYVFLGEWMHQGGDVLRPILASLGAQAAPLKLNNEDDQLEYMTYHKGAGALVAFFNHGGIAIGCDRLGKPRVEPPDPLVSKIKGPYEGGVEFRLAKLGLDPNTQYSLYEVQGIDAKYFDGVISGKKPFVVKPVKSTQDGGVLKADVAFDVRGEYVIAPKDQGEKVFFGK